MTSPTFEILDSLASVAAQEWNRLVSDGSPFLEYGFLRGLEVTDCLSPQSGWTTSILVARDEGDLVGAVPLYRKNNSAGEFVFDWSWAEAAMRAGISYYPKGVVAVPFSPVTGTRILTAEDCENRHRLARCLLEKTLDVADELGLSSVHFNFIPTGERALYEEVGLPIRQGIQYHWRNSDGTEENSTYRDFDEFLARFRSKRRSNIRRERRKLAENGVTTRIVRGDAITTTDIRRIFGYYVDTVRKHFYGRQYLSEEFFHHLHKNLTQRLHLVFCELDGEPFAGTFNLFKGDRLYGRYWGCERDINYAHFEACIYRPVQWCIEQGVGAFEPGAGGDHKFDRGFEPTLTYSAHYVRNPRLRRAVSKFLRQERRHIDSQLDELHDDSPFKSPTAPRRSS